MGKISNATRYPCFCILCNKIKTFTMVSKPTRKDHEEKDPAAVERRKANSESTNPVQPSRRIIKSTSTTIQDLGMEQSSTSSEVDLDSEFADLPLDIGFQEEEDYDDEPIEDLNNDFNFFVDDDEDTEPEFQQETSFSDPNKYPTEPFSFALVLMMLCIHPRYLTDEGAEIVMAFLNVILTLAQKQFRFPKTVKTFQTRINYDENFCSGLQTYVACSSCHCIHKLPADQQVRRRNLKCTFAKRISDGGTVYEKCNTSMYNISKKGLLQPKSIFMYNSIINTIKKFYLRPNFVESISAWKTRSLQHEDYYFDCYDADIFKNFKLHSSDRIPFVQQSPHNLMLSMNLDWFKQFKNSEYSMGGIYMTILNLPLEQRNLRKNMIFVGLMPGGNGEASLEQINNYLKPLVDELLIFMNGVEMHVPGVGNVTVKAASTMFCMDLPAASKTMGFSAHNSYNACRRCDKVFKTIPGPNHQIDFSETDDTKFKPRSKESNLQRALQFKDLTNATAKQNFVKKFGTRYSQFHRLPYVDCVKNTVYDPLHCVFIGSFKRIMHFIFLKRKLITQDHLKEMAQLTREIVLPPGYDSTAIAGKIVSGKGFGQMKADEWKVFTLALSPFLLKGRLDTKYYDHFMILVECIQIMSLSSISKTQVDQCHQMIRRFNTEFVQLYGKEEVVSNMHYHFHLSEDMHNYGPFASHHCFGYERYNGDSLGDADLYSSLCDIYSGKDIYGNRKRFVEQNLKGEVDNTRNDKDFNLLDFISFSGCLDGNGYKFAYGYEKLPVATILSLSYKANRKPKLNDDEYRHLLAYYQHYFKSSNMHAFDDKAGIHGKLTSEYSVVENKIMRFNSVKLLGSCYKSMDMSSVRGNIIFAYYRYYDEEPDKSFNELRPAQIQFFFRHEANILDDTSGKYQSFIFTFVFVKWLQEADLDITTYNTNNTRIYKDTYLNDSYLSILPVSCIHSPGGIYDAPLEGYKVVFKLPRKIYEE